jgi:hypothetical protein
MKNATYYKFYYVFLLVFSCSFLFGNAQTPNEDKLFESYKNYSKLPRETAYGHLNKSTLIKGESLGFSVYLLDKHTKKSSVLTKNVYCTLQNKSGKIVKNKMILAEKGVASGIFEIDSLFTTGDYIFKAYTNWMRNFDEQNFYVQHIKVIDPDKDLFIKADNSTVFNLDAQFLPEGGHLLRDTKNTVGVVIKDKNGFGIAQLSGTVLDNNGSEITNFTTNTYGICKFEFTPKPLQNYTIKLNDQKQTSIPLAKAKAKGVTMRLQDIYNTIILVFKTNTATLPSINNKKFKLSISNGVDLKMMDVTFKNKTEIAMFINYNDFYRGINIITLFDQNNTPLLERLYFNHDTISSLKTGITNVTKFKDSLRLKIPISTVNNEQFNSLSISVLPANTKPYNHHHNIISYSYLQPYIKGHIENARYYFTDINNQKKSDLDNLLLTQGWSSYEWNTIFNQAPSNQFQFEDGITVTTNLNSTKGNTFLFFPLKNTPSFTRTVKEGERNFSTRGLLLTAGEQLKVGVYDEKNRVIKPNLYAQFSPMEIPSLTNVYNSLNYKNTSAFKYDSSMPILNESWNKIESLDTVLLSTTKEKDRIEKIKRLNHGTVSVFDDHKRKTTPDLSTFLTSVNWVSMQNLINLTLSIRNGRPLAPPPVVYLNDMIINDLTFLIDLDMTMIDYIITDKEGLGEGMRGGGGVVKIYTNYMLRIREYSTSWESSQALDFPLSFSESKRFYTPLYSNYTNNFFQNYGVIDWFPICNSIKNNTIEINVLDTKNKQIMLFIEGVANNGTFISEEKIITIN